MLKLIILRYRSYKLGYYFKIFLKITKSTCRLRWRAPENDGGSAVTNYVIQLRKRDAHSDSWNSDFVPWETNVSDVEHVVVDLVAHSFEYVFRLQT